MPRPGQKLPVTDEWRAEVETKLRERKWRPTHLAKALDASDSTISALLGHAGKRNLAASTLVRPVSELLGIPLPVTIYRTPRVERMVRMFEQLDEEAQERFIGMLELLVDPRRQ